MCLLSFHLLGSADYSPTKLLFIIGSSRANQPQARRSCFAVQALADKTLENVENMKFELSLQSSSSEFFIISPNVTRLDFIDQDSKFNALL